MTWYQLWKRIGKQPYGVANKKDVTIKLSDGEHKCKIVYEHNGSDFHLELDEELEHDFY